MFLKLLGPLGGKGGRAKQWIVFSFKSKAITVAKTSKVVSITFRNIGDDEAYNSCKPNAP